MFRRRKPKVTESANSKPKTSTSRPKGSNNIAADDDELKQPKKLNEFKLADDKEELEERVTRSEPRSPNSRVGPPGKRPSHPISHPIRRPSKNNVSGGVSRTPSSSSSSIPKLKSSASARMKSPISRVGGTNSKTSTPSRARGGVSPKKTDKSGPVGPGRIERTNSRLAGTKKTGVSGLKKKGDVKLSSSTLSVECAESDLAKASASGVSVEQVVVDSESMAGSANGAEEEEKSQSQQRSAEEAPQVDELDTTENKENMGKINDEKESESAAQVEEKPATGNKPEEKPEDEEDGVAEVDRGEAQTEEVEKVVEVREGDEDVTDNEEGEEEVKANGEGDEELKANEEGEEEVKANEEGEEEVKANGEGEEEVKANGEGEEEVKESGGGTGEVVETEVVGDSVGAEEEGETADEIAEREMKLSENDPNHPPPRYIEGMHGDMPEATRRWANTLKWRQENNIDDVLSEDMPMYPAIRKHYSHFFHGHGKTGSVVLYIRPGKSDFAQLWKEWIPNDNPRSAAKQRLVVPDDLVRHHVFMLESLFQHWGPTVKGITGERATSAEMQRLIAVFDLQGFSFRSLRSFFGVFKNVVRILEQHSVGRADRIMVINAPNFRNVAYLVYPLVPKEVKAKIEICGRRYQERLREILVADEIPEEYGGDSKVPIGEWVLEKHINYMYNHPERKFPKHVHLTGEIIEDDETASEP